MPQPIKKTNNSQKPRSRTVKKKRKPTISEIIKKNIERSKKPHPKYGTSKLEKKFAKEFLDKLGIEYEEQFEAKDIKRFFDFKIKGRVLIEIDGDYYHSYGKVYEEMNPMQKKNARVDVLKNKLNFNAICSKFPVENLPSEFSNFNAVTMWYVIEHFENLNEVLSTISSSVFIINLLNRHHLSTR